MTDRPGSQRIVFMAANPSIDRIYEVERLAEGAIHRPLLAVAWPGGKGLNAARAAATLGARVTAVGIVAGRAGDWVVERLAELGALAFSGSLPPAPRSTATHGSHGLPPSGPFRSSPTRTDRPSPRCSSSGRAWSS